MLQSKIHLVPVLTEGKVLNAAQGEAIREIGTALERARSSDKPTFIVLRALSGTGKSTVLDGLREPLNRLDVTVIEEPDQVFSAARSAAKGKKFLVPLLPGASINSLLPWSGGGESRWNIETVNMKGFTKGELRVRIPRDLKGQPPAVIESILALSHGSTQLLQSLVRELKAQGFKPLSQEAGADIAIGFISHNLQTRGILGAADYSKFCSEFTSGEFALGADISPETLGRANSSRIWMLDARRTSAEFLTHEPWERYSRIAAFADGRMERLNEPGISVIAISNSPEETRRLVQFSESFEQDRLQREEGVQYRKTRVAVYDAPDLKMQRGWSTCDYDGVEPLRFPFARSERSAHAVLEIHTHEHYFEGKFLQLAALAESGLQRLRIPYYFSILAHNAHPVTVYFDPSRNALEPVTFTSLRVASSQSEGIPLLGRNTDDRTWALLESAFHAAMLRGDGNALIDARNVLPILCAEHQRREAPHLVRELEESLNRLGTAGEKYSVTTIDSIVNHADGRAALGIPGDATTVVVVGYGSYSFKNRLAEMQPTIDAAIGHRKALILCESVDPALFTEDTGWGRGRFKDAVLHELSFQRRGVHVQQLKVQKDTSDPEFPCLDWVNAGEPEIFQR